MAPGVDHVDDENFVINLLSLHNPHLIREAHMEQVLCRLQIGSDHATSPSGPNAPSARDLPKMRPSWDVAGSPQFPFFNLSGSPTLT
ncbi:hypothetical protein C356_03355 [Cryptococcus neoformans c45]|nr:hypothetical protein C356_03355 [Cryptococcus neoformans var. grubii c45]